MNYEPSEDEIQLAAKTLSKLLPGFLPFSIFHEITRLTTTPIVEVVPLCRTGDKVEILLIKRTDDDPVWPSQLHTPGTVIRATDTLQDCFDRVLAKELAGIQTSSPTFVMNVLHDSGRGNEAAHVFYVEVQGKAPDGEFYDICNLPQTLVKSQLDFIPRAIEAYVSRSNVVN